MMGKCLGCGIEDSLDPEDGLCDDCMIVSNSAKRRKGSKVE